MAQEEVSRPRMAEIIRVLRRAYPDAECSLAYSNPFQLLVATILSAQCTDERVNKVTPAVFERFGTPEKMSRATLPELERLIRSTGFYKNKAKALKASATDITHLHGGKVPRSLEVLTALHGVGRKTANVVLGNAFGIPSGIVVDTHVGRLVRRMGFTQLKDPVKVERALTEIVEKKDWTLFAHLMIHHGRAICSARKALCDECPVARLCPKIGV